MIRVVVVDDEAPARTKVRRFLADDPDAEIVGEAADGPEAIRTVQEVRPDVVLLDVRMPGADGFEVVDAIAEVGPHVVFATAFAEHAVRAFEVGAADYLLKPFDRERFRTALDRVKARIRNREPAPDAGLLREVLAGLRESAEGGSTGSRETADPLRRILVKEGNRSYFVPAPSVAWLEAEGNYVRVHVAAARGAEPRSYLVRSTLKNLARRLPRDRFARISRSVVVNLDRVREIQPWSHGDRLVVLEGGAELKLSRRYRDVIDNR